MGPVTAVRRAGRGALRWAASFSGLLGVSAVGVFLLQLLVPGDPAATLLTTQLGRIPSTVEIAAKRAELGLDDPFGERLIRWLGDLLRGDFGRAWSVSGDVADLIWPRVGATLVLGGLALAIALILALVGGIGAALARGRLGDRVLRVVAATFAAVPAFVLGLVVLQFVVVGMGIARVLADGSVRSALVPATLLGLAVSAAWTRPVRSIALDVLDSDVVRVARARGASTTRVVGVHVLPSVVLQFLPFLGLGIGSILGASAVMEVVFAWPGVGRYAIEAALRRDLPVLQAVVLLSILAYRLGNDAMRAGAWLLDPRRREPARR